MHGIVGQRTLGGTCWLYSRVGSDTIDLRFRFRFSAESPSSLSVAHTVSAECDTSLSAYFRSRPEVEFPLSVDLYLSLYYNWRLTFPALLFQFPTFY